VNRLAHKARLFRRLRFLDLAERLGIALAIPGEPGVVLVPHDATMRRKLLLTGHRGDITALARALQVLAARGFETRGRTFVDLGANLGTTSLAALQLHEFARVVACEPDPDNARFLRATAALNGLDSRLTVIEAAVAEHPGTVLFERATTGDGGVVAESSTAVEVEAVSLDSLVDQGVVVPLEVGLVWMDVQGDEGRALAGAGRVLETGVPVVAAVRSSRLDERGSDLLLTQTARFSTLVNLRGGAGWQPVEQPVSDALAALVQPGMRTTDVLLLP
jgi:FkbM family methyltransferase